MYSDVPNGQSAVVFLGISSQPDNLGTEQEDRRCPSRHVLAASATLCGICCPSKQVVGPEAKLSFLIIWQLCPQIFLPILEILAQLGCLGFSCLEGESVPHTGDSRIPWRALRLG
uniref:Uncharacterized protein n=1 Tax=Cercocebus atys TaxID=9531 RepID=A0A2K5KQY5_CERAT